MKTCAECRREVPEEPGLRQGDMRFTSAHVGKGGSRCNIGASRRDSLTTAEEIWESDEWWDLPTTLLQIVDQAAQRFDEKPLYRASIEARKELTEALTSKLGLTCNGTFIDEGLSRNCKKGGYGCFLAGCPANYKGF